MSGEFGMQVHYKNMNTYKITEGQRLTIEGIPVFATKDTAVEINPINIELLTPETQSHVNLVSAFLDAQSPSAQTNTRSSASTNDCI